MKLERIPEYVTVTVVIIAGIILSIFAGKWSGGGQFKWIAMVLGGILGVMAAIHWRTRLWLLIPVLGGMGGIPLVPGGLSLQQMAICYIFGVFLIFKALKLVRRKPTFDRVDLLLLLMLLLLVSEFIRHPVGGLILQSDRIGGKPYLFVAVSCLGYWVLSRVTITPSQAFWVPWITLLGGCFNAVAGFVADYFPGVALRLEKLYSGFAVSGQDTTSFDPEGVNRKSYLGGAGSSINQTVCSYFNPLTLINPLYFFRFLAFVVGYWFLLLSGFRSFVVGAVLYYLLAGLLRVGWMHVIRTAVILVIGTGLLILCQGRVFDLPLSIQRSLCFLPGNWDEAAKGSARESSEWRFEMWKDAMTTDRYIHNKWIGDGFGVDLAEWEAVQIGQMRGISQRIAAEPLAIMGTFHSGPISTIRFVGYVGLVLYYLLMFAIASKALRLIRISRNTPYFSYAIFNCAVPIIAPFTFTFIYGAFENEIPGVILSVGMMKMIETTLEEHRAQAKGSAQAPQGAIPSLPSSNPRRLPGATELIGKQSALTQRA